MVYVPHVADTSDSMRSLLVAELPKVLPADDAYLARMYMSTWLLTLPARRFWSGGPTMFASRTIDSFAPWPTCAPWTSGGHC